MAERGPVYGLDAELKAKRDAAYDPTRELEACECVAKLVCSERPTCHVFDIRQA
jgi:hypothetical protein